MWPIFLGYYSFVFLLDSNLLTWTRQRDIQSDGKSVRMFPSKTFVVKWYLLDHARYKLWSIRPSDFGIRRQLSVIPISNPITNWSYQYRQQLLRREKSIFFFSCVTNNSETFRKTNCALTSKWEWLGLQLQEVMYCNPPYDHPVKTATSLLRPLYSGPSRSSVKLFSNWKSPFNTGSNKTVIPLVIGLEGFLPTVNSHEVLQTNAGTHRLLVLPGLLVHKAQIQFSCCTHSMILIQCVKWSLYLVLLLKEVKRG